MDGIERDRLRQLVDDGFSIRQIAAELGVSYTTVLAGQARDHDAARLPARRDSAGPASGCGDNRGGVADARRHDVRPAWHGRFRCRLCRTGAVQRRRCEIKRILVAEAGGACALCGYDRTLGGLHFHHRDPAQKAFALSRQGVTRSLDAARAEAAKCVLLCSNCHAEVEAGDLQLPSSLLL